LSGRGLDIAAVVGGIDQQLRCVLPEAAFLDVLGLITNEIAHVGERQNFVPFLDSIGRDNFADQPRQFAIVDTGGFAAEN
jgi:hypothetical protein